MKATLSNYKQSPRKVRLVADLIRGKSVREARAALSFLPKKSSSMFGKLLSSALANARGASLESLVVKKLTVDKGHVLRRRRLFGRGRSGQVRKTTSHVTLELVSVTEAVKKITKKTTKRASKKLEAKS
ncbi:50S ribosomal protein L22 [Candidatus Kaiserbacteria bacterium RIFCSPHIGHO2_01_FULL_50_13]|uniref:Large ribosomal subunit protein uL22 n=1 Tax=Candidatus Kaiserbacteria bacterium RIFCSPLOWO2_01_FULL_50_24 TaxID=1798507 RepID=A0A1F6EMH3_9BACT|nr:MAG: 50S ribosomal protein L22 [Candidatus Kaiserbacteria bacterium RIFCSPHIGHO2_01_FULL_50_13]OGG74841.1 MAG: 50S ribosomal protein L22 [Candidatus Kaiserbacteria bacterium RIFCSPLOWO2_01_FULL_50_24]OGG81653.1 MAG: 50S ribosomal protein L22 [Candidatus Kaiserbacteria bacterium RIFCSPLOWO2_02_FULL_51_13]